LGRITFRDSHSWRFMSNEEFSRERSHSEQTAREIDEEISHILSQSLEKVRELLETHRKALVALSERLIEKEIVNAAELKELVEPAAPSPPIMPITGTSSEQQLGELSPTEAIY
jgi:cell division protease FtsH